MIRKDVGRADDAIGEDDVGADLDVEGPVTWVMEDEDAPDWGSGEVYFLYSDEDRKDI